MTTRHIEERLAQLEDKARAGLAAAKTAQTASQTAYETMTEVIACIQPLREAIKEPA